MLVNEQLAVVKEVQPSPGEHTVTLRVCVCVNERVHIGSFSSVSFAFVMLGLFIFGFLCTCACTVTKPELHLHFIQQPRSIKWKKIEEEQTQLLLEADGPSAHWKYVNKYL